MLKKISSDLRKLAQPNLEYWKNQMKNTYGLELQFDGGAGVDPLFLYRQLAFILKQVPPQLIKDSGLKTVLFRTNMGRNLKYSPNHGYYKGNLIALNADIFIHPDDAEDFKDNKGYSISRGTQTVIHEIGHAVDAAFGELSMQPAWMSLSGWSKTPKKGLKQIIIRDKGVPDVVGEMYYSPDAEFPRFYGRRNSYDDWADCFGFYVTGLKSIICSSKLKYFDMLLEPYYK